MVINKNLHEDMESMPTENSSSNIEAENVAVLRKCWSNNCTELRKQKYLKENIYKFNNKEKNEVIKI